MSSSGLIYAFIVGAWAVYLVPMWLRREDELNKARQTQRYTTAIKVLSHKESFERRAGAAAEREEPRELPLAVGQAGVAPAAGRSTLERVRAKERERAAGSVPAAARGAGSGSRSTATAALPGRSSSAAAAAAGPAGSSTSAFPAAPTAAGPGSASRASRPGGSAPSPATPPAASPSASSTHPRIGLLARRRRVVGVLFALTSLGAIVSADLGLGYLWAMLVPAAVLSAYIVRVRKEERVRAAELARRKAAAVRAVREAERRRAEREREQQEARRLEREELARRNAVARRRVAAARSRADRRTPGTGRGGSPDQGDLPRAANG